METASEYDQFYNQQQHEGKLDSINIELLLFFRELTIPKIF